MEDFESITPTLGLTRADRKKIESRIDDIRNHVEEHTNGRVDEMSHRLEDLDKRLSRHRNVMWFTLGVACCSLIVIVVIMAGMVAMKGAAQ